MSAQLDRYYRSSGAVPFKGTLLMLLAGTVAAAVFSFIYALVNRYNPFIYVTFVATIVFAAAIGAGVHWGASAGAVRNRMFVRLVAVVLGLLGGYLAWVWFVWMFFGYDPDMILLDPLAMLHVMHFLGQNGVWSVRGHTPTGFVLYGVWLLEAAAIAFLTAVTAVEELKPYCETCGRWCERLSGALVLSGRDRDALRRDLEEERYAALDERVAPDINPNDCVHVTIHRCPDCVESNYLTASHVKLETTKEGAELKTNDFIKYLWIPQSVVAQIQSRLSSADSEEDDDDTAEEDQPSSATDPEPEPA
jgi:hypothetical protein